ncbi:MAG TPA: ROK family transcriptional regulator [Micromonospora sp.]
MRAAPHQEVIRRHNLSALLRYVHIHGAATRTELAGALGLNRSTIGALTADLTAAGLVRESSPRETGRAGRPSLVVQPESDRVYAYAVSIEVDRLRVGRVGLGGKVLDARVAPRPHGMSLVDSALMLTAFVREMREAVPTPSRCVGSGIAVSRMTRDADGTARLTSELSDEAVHVLRAELGEDRPVAVGTVAALAARAEHTRGAAAGCDNLIYLHGDVGVSAGIIAGGRSVTGGGYGGEVGHVVVNPGGRRCSCGARGCWETEIGEHALLHAAGRDGQTGVGAVLSVIDAASRGDTTAQAALRHVGDWLGLGVANLVNIFNPEMVVFGGTLRHVYLAAAAQLRSRLNATALASCREQVRVRTTALGDDAPLLGAAELAFERLLADPLDVS